MDDIAELIGREVAGMPVWAWAVAIAGGIGVSWYIRQQGDAEPADSDDDDGPLPEQQPAGGGATQATLTVPPRAQSSDTADDDEPDSNAEWVAAAVDLAIDRGESPSRAQTIAQRVVTGQPLPAGTRDTVDIILSALGAPPDGAPSIRFAPREPEPDPEPDDDAEPEPEPEPTRRREPEPDPEPPPTSDDDDDPTPSPSPPGARVVAFYSGSGRSRRAARKAHQLRQRGENVTTVGHGANIGVIVDPDAASSAELTRMVRNHPDYLSTGEARERDRDDGDHPYGEPEPDPEARERARDDNQGVLPVEDAPAWVQEAVDAGRDHPRHVEATNYLLGFR